MAKSHWIEVISGNSQERGPRSEESEAFQIQRFSELASAWRDETEFSSSPKAMAAHLAYRDIIAMGKPAIPLILREMEQRPDHWFAVLRAITGEDPVPTGARGNVRAMTDAWLTWGRLHGQ